jgi:peroxiredoxin
VIKIGDTIPDVNLQRWQNSKVERISSKKLFEGKRTLLFAVPGAFTPTCSEQHLPGYVRSSLEFKRKGIDQIICISVNDAFTMNAWAKDQNIDNEVLLFADGNGEFTKSIGMELDATRFGLGIRSVRYAMLIDDGVVKKAWIENGGALQESKAEIVLSDL